MADNYYNTIQKLIGQLPDTRGEAMLQLMQKIIQTANESEDGDLAAQFARHLIEAASHEGRLDYEMIGFGELQKLYQTNSKFADLRTEILWYFKWLAERLPEYVEVPAEKIDSMLDRMEDFYRAEKEGLRPVHALRARIAAFMGRFVQAEQQLELWQKAPRQASDDCPACETDAQVELLLRLRKVEEAMAAAQPILAGDQSCEEVPAITVSRLLLPMLGLEKVEEALFLAMVVRRQLRHTPKLLGYLADHVMFFSILGIAPTARRLAVVMLAAAHKTENSFTRLLTARAAWIYFSRLKKNGVLIIALPRRSEPMFDANAVEIDKAISLYESRARELATAFDARNGTDRFSQIIETTQRLAEM